MRRTTAAIGLVLMLTACAGPDADVATTTGPPSAPDTPTDLASPASPTASAAELGGGFLASASVDPEVAATVAPTALDAAAVQALADLISAEGGDGEAVAAADPTTHLIAAFDLGECTVGDARLVLAEGALTVEGRESDGVCEAIDQEIQVWQVPWAQVPAGTTVADQTVSPP